MTPCRIAGVIAAIVAALTLAAPAGAQTGNGAEVIRFNDCYDDELVGTFCSAGTAVFNETHARDGQVRTVTANVNVHHFSFTGAGDLEGCHDEAKNVYNAHDLIVDISDDMPDGEPHQAHFVSINAFTGECFGDTYECRYQDEFTFANGEVRHTISRVECKDPIASAP